MNIKKKLSLGLADFEDIINKDKIYVDKTDLIEKIMEIERKYYFLSRPRRFGKSLFISTLKNLFEGKKELFKDTYIYDIWDWDEIYPVIRLDLSRPKSQSSEKFEKSLNFHLDSVAEGEFGFELKAKFSNDKFSELIENVCKNTGKEVVVLIDEYDKPILANADNEKIATDIRDDVLKDFYGVLKSVENSIKFVFITGVSKFAKTSIFSDLNNLVDLTIREEFSTICGYTQKELEDYFKDFIIVSSEKHKKRKEDLIESIKNWYNGYSWDGVNFLYNPYSILSFFDTNEFDNYWFETGTPSFLITVIEKQNNVDVLFDKDLTLFGSFPNFDVKNLDLKTILLQSGYLTIKEKIVEFDELTKYSLGIPNKKVRESLFSYILGSYVNRTGEDTYPIAKDMFRQLISIDEDGFQRSLELLFKSINYSLHSKLNDMEAFYHILFLSWMRIIGFDIQGEVIQLKNRLDCLLIKDDYVIILELIKDDYVIILELKYSKSESLDKLLDKAIKQIKENGYYKPYQNKKTIIFVGIAFKNKEVKCRILTYL
ncbi:MAG: ATP-binding protein [Methanobrevibacter sp.]|nr:ATP-binding protein [Methanobrevibacter sp.]